MAQRPHAPHRDIETGFPPRVESPPRGIPDTAYLLLVAATVAAQLVGMYLAGRGIWYPSLIWVLLITACVATTPASTRANSGANASRGARIASRVVIGSTVAGLVGFGTLAALATW